MDPSVECNPMLLEFIVFLRVSTTHPGKYYYFKILSYIHEYAACHKLKIQRKENALWADIRNFFFLGKTNLNFDFLEPGIKGEENTKVIQGPGRMAALDCR